MGFVAMLMFSYLAVVKFALGEDIGGRPLLLVGAVLAVASLQFITTGVLAEMLSRVFFQASNLSSYTVRQSLQNKTLESQKQSDQSS
jgi:hypothetical protein